MKLRPLALLALASASAFAAPPADLDSQVQQAMQRFEVPGLALTVVENGQTTVARGYGLRQLGGKSKTDERTLFPIGSCTKAFTAAALGLLVEEGKIGWDDKVIDRLPGFRLYDGFASQELTIRDLLVHRSGLGLGAGDLLFFPPTTYTRAQVVERLRHIKPASSFRSGYAYDNVLYVVAGQLVEAVSGQSWEDFTEQRLFKPLGMKDSSTQVDRVLASKNRTRLHGRFDGPMRGMGTLEVFKDSKEHLINQTAGPAGSIYASAADMAPWLKLMLANGELGEGKRLLSAANAAELFKPQTIEPGDRLPAVLDGRRPNFVLYALGWNVMDYRGHKIIVHSGAVEGGKAVVGLLPEKGIGLSILMNSEDGGARWGLFYQLLDHYLGLPPQDWTGKFKTAVEEMSAKGMEALKQMQVAPQAEAAGGPSLPLAKYVGSYRDAWYGDMKISADATGKKLSVAFLPTPTMQGPLEHVRHDTFRTRFADRSIEDTFLTFALKPDGSIDQIKLQAVSPLADFSFDFHDLLFTPTP